MGHDIAEQHPACNDFVTPAFAEKGYYGYVPIVADLGDDGWRLNLEFREGSQQSQNSFIPFLYESPARASVLTKSPLLLLGLDSAHDALKTRSMLSQRRQAEYILRKKSRLISGPLYGRRRVNDAVPRTRWLDCLPSEQ